MNLIIWSEITALQTFGYTCRSRYRRYRRLVTRVAVVTDVTGATDVWLHVALTVLQAAQLFLLTDWECNAVLLAKSVYYGN